MEYRDRAKQIIAAHGMLEPTDIILNPNTPGGILVPVRLITDPSGKRFPSHKILAEVRAALLEAGFDVEFLVSDESAKSAEDGLRTSLISSFPEIIRNSFIGSADNKNHVWLETKRSITNDESQRIRKHVQTYSSLFKVFIGGISLTNDGKIAANFEVLRAIRLISPANCEDVIKELTRRGFDVPSPDWVNRKFDALRRAGLLIRMNNRSYALTSEALHRLGTHKGRQSPDVGRLLALARRRG